MSIFTKIAHKNRWKNMKLFGSKLAKNEDGFTTVDFLLAAGLIAVSGLGIYLLFGSAQNTNQIASSIQGVQTLSSAVESGYGNASDMGTGDITGVIDSVGGMPDNMRFDDGAGGFNYLNSWGGAVSIAAAGQNYTITYAGVPDEACAILATREVGQVSTTLNTGAANPGPAPLAISTAQCDQGANAVIWTW